MATLVSGELKEGLLNQLYEIERQIRQSRGYPFDPHLLRFHLQEAIEGRFAEPELVYPEWVQEHLTPALEATALRDPGAVELWLDSRQSGPSFPTGDEVYDAIKSEGLLERSLSYGDLKFLEAHPDRIPAEFRDKRIYGWTSVVRRADGSRLVPYLDCRVEQPCVFWFFLGFRWIGREPAGLRK